MYKLYINIKLCELGDRDDIISYARKNIHFNFCDSFDA